MEFRRVRFRSQAAKEPWELASQADQSATKKKLKDLIGKDIAAAYKLTSKSARSDALNAARAKAKAAFADATPQDQMVAIKLVKKLEAEIVRGAILKDGHRIDGRNTKQIRSEEHTSELQSLMRISYAVFCLQKNNNTNSNTHTVVH